MKSHSKSQLVILLTVKTFSIGYLDKAPLCVYADMDTFDGIETARLKQKLVGGPTVYNVHKASRASFKLERIYKKYLK